MAEATSQESDLSLIGTKNGESLQAVMKKASGLFPKRSKSDPKHSLVSVELLKKEPLSFQPVHKSGASIMISPLVTYKRSKKEMDAFIKHRIMTNFDAVQELQNVCIGESLGRPRFKLVKEIMHGSNKTFRMNCLVGNLVETAERSSIEEAKQLVAHQMLLALALVMKVTLPESLNISQGRSQANKKPMNSSDPEEPCQPAENPSQPAEKPSKPTEKPSQSGEKPSQPAEKPSQSAKKPSKPAEKPSKPAEKPSKPAEKPSKPSEKPSKPAEKPSKPSEKPRKPAEKPTQLAEESASGKMKSKQTPKNVVPIDKNDGRSNKKDLWVMPEAMKLKAQESIRQNDSLKSLAKNCECLKLSEPCYTFIKKVKTPDEVTYTYSCQVNEFKSTGFGGTKKQAKQMAAEKMFQTLSKSKGILTDSQAEMMSTLQVVSTTTNFLTKVLEHPMRPCNQSNKENKSGSSSLQGDEEGAEFSLKGVWTKKQLEKLQNVKKPFEDPVEILADIAKELDFHVTYDNSHSTPGLPIVTVKLSTTPECLLMGQGGDAMNDAATAAILCLQVMTEN